MSVLDRASRGLCEAGLYLFALALPFNLWATQAGLGLAALALGVRWAFLGERPRIPWPLMAPVTLYLVAIGLSHLGSGERVPGLEAALGFWPVLAPFVLAAAIRDERVLRNMLTFVLSMAALMGLYGVLQHFTGVDYFRLGPSISRAAPATVGRFIGIGNFEAHTTFAFSLAFPALLAGALAAEAWAGWRTRLALTLASASAIAGIVVSYVRSIWLGLLLGVGAIAVWRRGPAVRIAIGLVAVGVVAVASVPTLRARALSVVDPAYNAGRVYIWERSWRMLVDHPVTGIGFGGYRFLHDAYFDPQAPPEQVPRTGAHSTYLHLAVETGILGLVAFLWIWVRWFRWAHGVLRRIPPARRFARGFMVGAMAAVICFLAGSFFQESFFDGEVAFMLWFVVAGAFALDRAGEAAIGPPGLDRSV
jgi:putative inorganic carbon (HCO3(-)) transporter